MYVSLSLCDTSLENIHTRASDHSTYDRYPSDYVSLELTTDQGVQRAEGHSYQQSQIALTGSPDQLRHLLQQWTAALDDIDLKRHQREQARELVAAAAGAAG